MDRYGIDFVRLDHLQLRCFIGLASKQKGKRGEREAAAELRRLFGAEARRGVQYSGGTGSPDVVHSIHGVHIEVKRAETLNLSAALQQAIDDAGEQVPVVLHKKNNKPWLAIVRLDDLPKLTELLYLTLAAKGN